MKKIKFKKLFHLFLPVGANIKPNRKSELNLAFFLPKMQEINMVTIEEKFRALLIEFNHLEKLFKTTQLALLDFKTSVLNEYRYCARALVDYSQAITIEHKSNAISRAEVALSAAYNDLIDFTINAAKEGVNCLYEEYPNAPVGAILKKYNFDSVLLGIKEANKIIASSRKNRHNRFPSYIELANSPEFESILGFLLNLISIEYECELASGSETGVDSTTNLRKQELLGLVQVALQHHAKDQVPRFEIYYQPKFSRSDDSIDFTICGAEALIRLRTNEGLLAPGVFLNLAHRADLTHRLNNWVVDEVISDAKTWKEEILAKSKKSPFDLATNLLPNQFASMDFVSELNEKFSAADVEGIISVELIEKWDEDEVDESGINKSADSLLNSVSENILKLNERTRIYIDDFGTGSTKLHCISNIENLYAIKLDKHIIDGLLAHDSSNSRRLISGIVAFAEKQNIQVIAEGVEENIQIEALLQLGVSLFQGFHPALGRPIPRDDFYDKHLAART